MPTTPPGGFAQNTINIITPASGPYSSISGVESHVLSGSFATNRTGIGNLVEIREFDDNTLLFFKNVDMTLFEAGEKIVVNGTELRIIQVHGPTAVTVEGAFEAVTGTFDNPLYFFEPNPDNADEDLIQYQWSLSSDGTTPSNAWQEMTELTTDVIPHNSTWYILLRVITYGFPVSSNVLAYYHDGHTIVTTSYVAPVEDCVGLECDDPFSSSGTGAVIEVDCSANPTNVFNPYAQNKSVNLYKQLNNIVSDLFGHQVNYFRTEADPRTKDVTLMEYSLNNVADNKNVKILVPDNEFPSEANTFDIFGMEFAEFEVHIVHEKFKDVFGSGVRPRAKDYMFIPIINKMYEVSSVSIADEFNAAKSYWRVKLTKYQDRSSVIKGTYDTATDNLITGIEEVFGEEIKDEQTKVTKPVQFQSVSKVLEDGHRVYKDGNLTIKDEAIINNFMTISNNHYDLSKVTANTTALRYNKNAAMITDGQLGITAWIRPTFEITNNSPQTIITCGTLCRVTINTTVIAVNLNGTSYKFTHNTSMSKDKWYGVVVNIKNNTQTLEAALYSISVVSGAPAITSLVLEERPAPIAIVGGQVTWSQTLGYELHGGKLNVTNVRVFDKEITASEEIAILNQYVVRDNDHSIIIDNAIPSLGYQKFKNAK